MSSSVPSCRHRFHQVNIGSFAPWMIVALILETEDFNRSLFFLHVHYIVSIFRIHVAISRCHCWRHVLYSTLWSRDLIPVPWMIALQKGFVLILGRMSSSVPKHVSSGTIMSAPDPAEVVASGCWWSWWIRLWLSQLDQRNLRFLRWVACQL